jgi:23S rRNA (adenine2030-N6)-methyltransferase
MHYRHAFHAANFADVFKHVLLIGLLTEMSKKDKPWVYIDTHAGAGVYDLGGGAGGSAEEWRHGIALLGSSAEPGTAAAPKMVEDYRAALRMCGFDFPAAHLRYPGSPELARSQARSDIGDRLVLCEKVEAVAETLRRTVRGSAIATHIHLRNGYEAWSLLPPPEKRGLLLIDPPFEQPGEFDAIAELAGRVTARFASGVQAIWYPRKDERACNHFLRRVARETGRPTLDLRIDTDGPARSVDANGIAKRRMTACGLLVVNPPFGFQDEARVALPWLSNRLAQGPAASWSIEPVAG